MTPWLEPLAEAFAAVIIVCEVMPLFYRKAAAGQELHILFIHLLLYIFTVYI